MAAIDRMAAAWSAGIVVVAIGAALAASLAGPESTVGDELPAQKDLETNIVNPVGLGSTSGDELPAQSAMCEAGGHVWSGELGVCYVITARTCEESLAKSEPAVPGSEPVQHPPTGTASGGAEPTIINDRAMQSAICESRGDRMIEGTDSCAGWILLAWKVSTVTVCEGSREKPGCEDPILQHCTYHIDIVDQETG